MDRLCKVVIAWTWGAACAAVIARPAAAIEWDWASMGDGGRGTVAADNCGVRVAPIGGALRYAEPNGLGIGSVAGQEAGVTEIDGSEGLTFSYQLGNRHVEAAGYTVSFATTLDGDLVAGEHTVEAFDADGSLGIIDVFGTGFVDVTTLFSGAPLRSYTIRADGDSLTIASFSWQVPVGDAVAMNFGVLADQINGTYTDRSIEQCGVFVDGSASLQATIGAERGVGVVGGLADAQIEDGETITVEVREPFSALGYRPSLEQDIDNDGLFGESRVEAFTPNGLSLGTVDVDGTAFVDLVALFPGQSVRTFSVTGDGDSLRLESVNYVAAPEASSAVLGTAALLALAALRRRSPEFRRDNPPTCYRSSGAP